MWLIYKKWNYNEMNQMENGFGSFVWNLKYISSMKLLENVQRRWTRRIYDFQKLTYHQRLKDLDLFLVEESLQKTDVMKCWKTFHSKCRICPENIFVLTRSGINRGHQFTFFMFIYKI